MIRDRDASFREVVGPTVDRLYRTAILLTGGDHHQAEDLVQATLARLYARRRWEGLQHPAAYLHKMLVNEHISRRRRRASGETVLAEPPAAAGEHRLEDDSAAYLDLFRALAQLSRTDRTVVVLRYWDDLSVAETADLTGLSPGAVRNRCARALGVLRSSLPGYRPASHNHAGPVAGLRQGDHS